MGIVLFLVGLLVGEVSGVFLTSILSINSKEKVFKEGVNKALDTLDEDTDEEDCQDENSYDDTY